MKKAREIWTLIFSPAFFSAQVLIVMVAGGILAAILMRPWLDAGPVRLTTYALLGISSTVLAWRYISMVRRSKDGKATLFVVASCWVWVSLSTTGFSVLYLLLARAFNLWPNWGENPTERFLYFFISATAIAITYKAFTFARISDEALVGTRVSAWPFTLFRRRRKRYNTTNEESED